MKKSTKIILPALAVLVLGTAAATTGTVAWFASNNVVHADGMSVKCATSKNLLIANNEAGTGANITATATNTETRQLKPSSAVLPTGTDADFEFYYVDDAGIVANTGAIKTGATLTKATGSEETKVYAEYSFWLQAQGDNMTDLVINSITVTSEDEASDISKSLRFGVVYESVYGIVALRAGADASYEGLMMEGEAEVAEGTGAITVGGEEATATVTPTSLAQVSSIALGGVPVDEWTEIKFYFWYEGQDSNCITKNAKNVETLSFDIQMSAE